MIYLSMYTSFRISNVKPCSINKAYYKTKKVLTIDGRRYRKRLLCTISKSKEIVEELMRLRLAFDDTKHALRIYIIYYIPRHEYYTQEGKISMRSGDVDNYAKLTTDFLCNSKYIGHKFPEIDTDIQNLGIDDRYIVDYDSSKRPSHNRQHHIDFHIEIIDKSLTEVETQSLVLNTSSYKV